jgi:hypothetical protein
MVYPPDKNLGGSFKTVKPPIPQPQPNIDKVNLQNQNTMKSVKG